jgi:2-oxoglutarate dehydrogenase E1 component
MSGEAPKNPSSTGFGPNEWLVDEIYQQYISDKNSVDPSWWEFFKDYSPVDRNVAKIANDANNLTPVIEPLTKKSIEEIVPIRVKAIEVPASNDSITETIRGTSARVVTNMEASLKVPTATSVRSVPAILLQENRTFINNHLARQRGGKVSYTHIIAYAVAKAVSEIKEMNTAYTVVDDKPAIIKYPHVGLGLAIDLAKPDGSRQLLVPNIKYADVLDFAQFWSTYDDLVRRARAGKLTVEDFQGTTISVTNPGTIGTQHSVPRLMEGQGAIIGVGALDFPTEWQGAAPETLARQAISRVITLTSTYDHRIIQGAQSGEFLKRISELLLGKNNFYEDIFASLEVPYKPYVWAVDIATTHDEDINKVARVQELIHYYRVRGHLISDTNPLEYAQRTHPDLRMANHGLSVWDLEREFATGGFGGVPFMKLRDILSRLQDSYTRSIGVEYMHIQEPEERKWIQERVEKPHERMDRQEQLRILRRLNAAEAFEKFLHTKYVGQKRFSLEGSESAIVSLDSILVEAANDNLLEVDIAMPHRGRLNVLANIAGKSYERIFREFEDVGATGFVQGSGDVKYHLGTYGKFTSEEGNSVPVYLAANPSHLEAVDPVLEGIVRAKQDKLGKGHDHPILPVLMHGDASFAGQGVVLETLNLSKLRGYNTGGTIHLIVNNQVGFTTSPADARSSTYASDMAKTIQAPIFHVNGDDPESVSLVSRLAYRYRKEFKKDVIIDMITYRRRGHNEADDPSLTQPLMYQIIDEKRSVRKLYTESLIGRGDITVEEAENALIDYQNQLERVLAETKGDLKKVDPIPVDNRPSFPAEIETKISRELIDRIAQTQVNLREGFTPHPRLWPQLERRAQMIKDDTIDWAMGEVLAVGSLLTEGHWVRIAGQDARRGTFGQRHGVIVDYKTGQGYKPLKQVAKEGTRLFVIDSALTEFAGMGFEYGYSVASPKSLVMWEGQFGDFANGAQTIIDEFISSGEQKWQQESGLVLLLPHGMEGQGPDHSSGRIERFLSLAAQDNMTIAQPSTSASYFHLLRWQVLNPHNKPLIIFTPKSMLRAKPATSATKEFTDGKFNPAIEDAKSDRSKVTKIVLCTGKISHEIAAARDAANLENIAIIRLERLFPLPVREIKSILSGYANDAKIIWAQDEPANQGAYPFVMTELAPQLGRIIARASRPSSSAPAVGSHTKHDQEQSDLIKSIIE